MLPLTVTSEDLTGNKRPSELAMRLIQAASDQHGPEAAKEVAHAMAVGLAGVITAQHGPEAAVEVFTKLLVNLVAAHEELGLYSPNNNGAALAGQRS